MANSKISALTSATTPLAGTETLPIVQSGATKQVSVANLTVGRTVTASGVNVTGAGGLLNTDTTGTGTAHTYYKDNAVSWVGGVGTKVPGGSAQSAIVFSKYDGAWTQLASISGSGLTLNSGNVIVNSGNGIDFSATPGTGTSELLNDYEEGDWTPADASGAGLVFTVNYAKYTKVGRQVSYIANIAYPITASGAAASIQGFPFVAGNAVFGNVNYTTEPAASLLYFAGNTTTLFLLVPGLNTTNAQMSGEALIFSGTYFI